MRKVQLNFILVGKSDAWERKMAKDKIEKFTNVDRLDIIKDLVAGQFGSRTLEVVDEKRLLIPIMPYPEFYSAGWFVSNEDDVSELVVVGHGNTMELATNAMLDGVKSMDWEETSKKVEYL